MATLTKEEYEQKIANGETAYKKTCKSTKCSKEFYSDSRNQRYCCQGCSDYMQGVNKKRTKVRARKRKEYDKNKEINRALTKAYSLCETLFELYQIPKVCNCAEHGYTTPCSGPLERNHKDLNPFNNSPDNLEYMCKSHHAKYHTEMGDVNMVETYNEAVDAAGFEDDDKKHIVMIEYTVDKIKKAQEEGAKRIQGNGSEE